MLVCNCMNKNENTLVNTPTKVDNYVYSLNMILICMYIGGPIAGCYLMYKNFLKINKPKAAKIILWMGILALPIYFLLLYVLLGVLNLSFLNKINIPQYSIPILYTSLTYWFVKIYQMPKVKDLVNKGYVYYSWLNVIGVILVSLFISALMYGFLFILAALGF